MAESSIFANFVIKDKKTAKAFVDALEKSAKQKNKFKKKTRKRK